MKEGMISVIVPVYNSEKTLARCVDSIIEQTYANLEVILVDDGSTDNSPAICDDYASKDARIKVIHQPNRKLPAARNAGIDASNGEYIAYVDSDDYLDLTMYEKMHRAIMDQKADMAFCRYYEVRGGMVNLCDTSGERSLTQLFAEPSNVEYLYYGKKMVSCMVWRQLISREFLGNFRFNEEIPVIEDVPYTTHLLLENPIIAVVNEPLYYYVLSDFAAKYFKADSIPSLVKIGITVSKDLESHGMQKLADYNSFFRYLYVFTVYYLPDKNNRKIKKMLKDNKELQSLNSREGYKEYYSRATSGIVRLVAKLTHYRLYGLTYSICKLYKKIKGIN